MGFVLKIMGSGNSDGIHLDALKNGCIKKMDSLEGSHCIRRLIPEWA